MQTAIPRLIPNTGASNMHSMDAVLKDSSPDSSPGKPSSAGPLSEAPPSEATDERLMLAFARGDNDAFTELFARYKQPLFGFFRRRVPEPALAEELTQETFLALLNASHRYQPSALFRTYLYAIGFRLLHTYRRKAAFRAMFHSDAKKHREPSQSSSIDAELQIRQALKRLEPMDREVLMLREFEQLSYAEIAELLQLQVNTVRSRLFRARTAARDILTAPATKAAAAEPAECESRI